jgi:hypothetical protein
VIKHPNKAWVALAALTSAGAVAGASAGAASEGRPISFTVRNNGTAYLTRAGLTHTYPGYLTTGDQIFSRDTLVAGTKTIGYDNEQCAVTFDGNDLCRAVSVFPGRGDIDATWLWIGRNTSVLGPHRFTGVIDGGTGTYTNATGQFEATVNPDGTLQITATLG